VHAVQARVEARVLRTVQKNAQVVVTLVVGRNITPYDVAHYATGQAEERDMDADVASLAGSGELVGLEVWSLADGRRSTPTTPIRWWSRRWALTSWRGRAPARSAAPRRPPGGALAGRVHPVRPAGGQHYVAVAEVRLPSDPIAGAIRAWTIALYAGAGLAVALAFIAIAVFRRRHTLHEYAARHDALTGLGNRLLLTEETKRVLVNTSRYG